MNSAQDGHSVFFWIRWIFIFFLLAMKQLQTHLVGTRGALPLGCSGSVRLEAYLRLPGLEGLLTIFLAGAPASWEKAVEI
jgi:hypothetical protein